MGNCTPVRNQLKGAYTGLWRPRDTFVVLVVALLGAIPLDVVAKEITGTIETRLNRVSQGEKLGYIRARITSGTKEVLRSSPPVAVFMAVKESLPLETINPSEVTLDGLTLEPAVAACAVDGSIVLRNRDRSPATFVVINKESTVVFEMQISPGDKAVYECTAGADGAESRQIRVTEWPLVRGTIYVGEVGTPGVVSKEGRFSLLAPNGTYVLRVIGQTGILHTVDVEVDDQPVNVGVIKLSPAIEN
ncbi:MAG: hypothetical protein KTR25_14760 [Myxococcales bacterium]|nr:hypothetical protein [Myxococcales bacterium]